MNKRPYFIKKDMGDTFGRDLFISQEMNKYIKDLITPIKNFNEYYFTLLLGNFYEIMSLPSFVDASNLPISNYPAIPTWEKILRISLEIIERCYLTGKKNELFQALNLAVEKIGEHQKVEYYSECDIPEIETIKNSDNVIEKKEIPQDDRLRKMLLHYHELYDGSYKFCLSLFHYLSDLLENKINRMKKFESYINEDVSQKIKKLKEISQAIKLQYGIDWLLVGADNHIRNAIAHKRWKFEGGAAKLHDSDGWQSELNYFQIDDLIRSINIGDKGMQAGIIIGLAKYAKEFNKTIPLKHHDIEEVHGILYHMASVQYFLLDDFSTINDKLVYCKLKEEIIGRDREIIVGNKYRSVKMKLPPIRKRNDRIKGFIFKSIPLFWDYKEITIEVFASDNKIIGMMKVNLEKWSEMYYSGKKYDKREYENHITINSISDEGD